MIFTKYIHKMYFNKSSKTDDRPTLPRLQQVLHNIVMSTITLCAIFDALHGLAAMVTNTELLGPTAVPWGTYCMITADVCYYTTSLLLYNILTHRLFKTFANTAFAISNRWYYWIIFQLVLQPIIMIIYLSILSFDNCNTEFWCNMLGVFAAILTANDYTLNAVLISLFVRKLRQLIVTQLKYEIADKSPPNSPRSTTASVVSRAIDNNGNSQKELLRLVTKQSVLGTFLVLINQAFATAIFCVFTFSSTNTINSLVVISLLIRGAEGSFMGFLLYIGIGINSNEYMKICKTCHDLCYNLCIKMTAKKVNKAVMKHNEDQSAMELHIEMTEMSYK